MQAPLEKEIALVELAPGVMIGGAGGRGAHPLPVIAGPCVIESEDLVVETAHVLAAMAERLGVALVLLGLLLISTA